MYIAVDLYKTIVSSMPIVCVDLLVRDPMGCVLLLKRSNKPAQNQWWLPGGRVLMNERLTDAARRKALQECGLVMSSDPKLRGTHELFFDEEENKYHSITTVFEFAWTGSLQITLDAQSKEFKWFDPKKSDEIELHPFIRQAVG